VLLRHNNPFFEMTSRKDGQLVIDESNPGLFVRLLDKSRNEVILLGEIRLVSPQDQEIRTGPICFYGEPMYLISILIGGLRIQIG